jgi:hypothetical protein
MPGLLFGFLSGLSTGLVNRLQCLSPRGMPQMEIWAAGNALVKSSVTLRDLTSSQPTVRPKSHCCLPQAKQSFMKTSVTEAWNSKFEVGYT